MSKKSMVSVRLTDSQKKKLDDLSIQNNLTNPQLLRALIDNIDGFNDDLLFNENFDIELVTSDEIKENAKEPKTKNGYSIIEALELINNNNLKIYNKMNSFLGLAESQKIQDLKSDFNANLKSLEKALFDDFLGKVLLPKKKGGYLKIQPLGGSSYVEEKDLLKAIEDAKKIIRERVYIYGQDPAEQDPAEQDQ